MALLFDYYLTAFPLFLLSLTSLIRKALDLP